MNTATYISNRTYNRKLNMTPFEAYTGSKPNLTHLRKFGAQALVHIPKDKRNKLEPRATKMRLVGYTETSVNYRLIDESNKRIFIETNVHFLKEDVDQLFLFHHLI